MNRLSPDSGGFVQLPHPAPEASTLTGRSVREPSLLRLAQSIEELNPALARALCRSGLAAMVDPVERESWWARLAPWLEDSGDGGDDDDGLALAAA